MASTPESVRTISRTSNVRSSSSTHTALEEKQLLKQVLLQKLIPSPVQQKLALAIGEDVLSGSSAMGSENFSTVTARDLERMAEMYDALYFDSLLLSAARRHQMVFRWSGRMTSAGGKTIRSGRRDSKTGRMKVKYEIALSAPLLFQTFRDLNRPIRVTGFQCRNRLQAMQRILEHELIHLAEMLVWDDSCCSAPRFHSIANRMFGHTEHKHDLVTQQERAAKKYNVRVGSMVSFPFQGKQLVGKVNRITRRATILVPDPVGHQYSDGRSYRKYYVPLQQLKAV
ncbi:MAG: hypothetical protein U0892_14165 [Pirellulales bacterium]